MATIVVTASSLRISGGLTILRQFVSNLPLSDDKYYIFVDPGHTCVPQDNIEYIPVATRSQWARLKFDFCGFAKELKRRAIRPDLIISLQNNGLRFDKRVPQIVYFISRYPCMPNGGTCSRPRNARCLCIRTFIHGSSDSLTIPTSITSPRFHPSKGNSAEIRSLRPKNPYHHTPFAGHTIPAKLFRTASGFRQKDIPLSCYADPL